MNDSTGRRTEDAAPPDGGGLDFVRAIVAEDGSAVICFKGVWPLEWASYQDDEETPGVDLHLLVDWIPDESAGVERGLWVPMDPETGYFEGCLSLVTGDPPGAVLTDGVCPILAYLDLELSAERYLAGQFLEVRDTTMVFQAWDVTGL